MNWRKNRTIAATACGDVREQFSSYLDGALSGVQMHSMAEHMDGCSACATDFSDLRELQSSLAQLGPAKAPAGLQARLRAALVEERDRGTHLAWHQQAARVWRVNLAPIALRTAMGTAAAMVLVAGMGLAAVVVDAPTAVQANDEPLGAVTAPHYLYSEVPPQPIEFGREAPIMIEAMVNEQGRVYDYKILSGPSDVRVERQVQANLLSSRFQPATIFGLPVPGRVVMTYTGVSVRG
jgi:hypothetical protein